MSAPIIQAQYPKLAQISSQFSSASDANRKLTTLVEEQINVLRRGRWESESADSFYSEMQNQVLPALERLTKAFESTGVTIDRIIQVLKQAERDAAAALPNNLDRINGGDGAVSKDGKLRIFAKPTMRQGSLFVTNANDGTDIHPSDAKQGSLANCYFVSPLAAIAQQNPDFIRNSIKDNGDGTYTVTFYEYEEGFFGSGGFEPVQITVNGELPTGQRVDKNDPTVWNNVEPHIPTTQNSSDAPEMWAAIYEKAYIQKFGNGTLSQNYIAAEWGDAGKVLERLTGQSTNRATEIESLGIEELARRRNEGYALNLSSLATGGGDLYRTQALANKHVYYITDVDVNTGMVTIENPWGWQTYRQQIPFDQLDENFRELSSNPISPRQ